VTEHKLKSWPEYFERIICRRQEFDIRKMDRPFVVGETLRFQEWIPETSTYTGREAVARVTCCLTDCPGLQDGYGVMGLVLVKIVKGTEHAEAH
jgi:hypothetical protein